MNRAISGSGKENICEEENVYGNLLWECGLER